MATSDPNLPRLDALPDTVDFRDTMYIPTLVRVPAITDIDTYRERKIPVLNQERNGACTGYGLATVANYLLRVRGQETEADEVSAWMLYAMAKRYDDWPGEDYSGSSARGAIKGWYKHGLCAWKFWQSEKPDPSEEDKRSADAIERPLGAYFRVNHRDLVAMHSAIAEVGVLFATGYIHQGWADLMSGGEQIPPSEDILGGHAFAIVGYDRTGFWIQNSWGNAWGEGGIARLTYDDWLANGNDVWVAALGAPVVIAQSDAGAVMHAGAPRRFQSHILADLRPHIITSKNGGILDDKGDYGLTPDSLKTMIGRIPSRMPEGKPKRLLLYAHGGLVGQDSAVQMLANDRQTMLDSGVYPISFIWRSDAWSTIKDILQNAVRTRRDESFLDSAKDFMLDRLDDMLEPTTRLLGGKALWDEMKANAMGATDAEQGAARLAVEAIAGLYHDEKLEEVHLVGHSAGSIYHAHLAQLLVKLGVPVASLTLWAPACTMALFEQIYRPLIVSKDIKAFNLFTLDDVTEKHDNCANIYHKSLLYLVSAAFEARVRIPLMQDIGEPLLGLERDIKADPALEGFVRQAPCQWFRAPGPKSGAQHHGSFDDDDKTLHSTLELISGAAPRSLVDAAPKIGAGRPRPVAQQRQLRSRLNDAMDG